MNSKTFNNIVLTSVILVGLFTGVLFAASLAISPSLTLLDASNFTLVKQAQIRILQVSMSAISGVYSLLALYIMYYAKKHNMKQVFSLSLTAFSLVMLALLYSAFTDIPYNQQILTWNVDSPPANWAHIRYQWDLSNLIRTFPSVLAFILQAAALLFLNRAEDKQ